MEGMYGRLIETIIEWSDEFYSYNLAQEVRRGMTEKAMRGGYQCKPPIGYTPTPDGVPVNRAGSRGNRTAYLPGIRSGI